MRPDLMPQQRLDLEMKMKEMQKDLKETGVEIRDFRELNECIQLDTSLGKLTDEVPVLTDEDKQRMGEGTTEKIDAIMEFFRRKAKDLERAAGG